MTSRRTIQSSKIYDSNGDDILYPFQVYGSLTANFTEATDLTANGKIVVGTTPLEVAFSGVTQNIILNAALSNTAVLYFGKSDIGSAGTNAMTYLESGDSVILDYNDTSNPIYIVAADTNQSYWSGALL